jgi:protein SCO1/2
MRFLLAAAVFAAVPVAASDLDSLHTDLGPVPPFRLTDQLGRTVTKKDLLGKVWVANFFFTHCAGDCSKTNATMAKLQHDLADYPDVLLVGFSVDPEDDTPSVLRQYGRQWDNDPARWLMLTGPEKEMYELIQKGFLQAVEKNKDARPGFEVTHTFSLVIVDAKGEIRGYVKDGRDSAVAALVEARVRELLPNELRRLLPAVNASLNGACVVLLLLGYVAIRCRRLLLHKTIMLSALATSAAFLASYLYYHLIVQHGAATPFGGTGLVRPIYYGILTSHILLAAVIVPLALVVALLGLTGLLRSHKVLARWTLPLWLYVSVTGVVVYWMLYHLYPPGR